MGRVKEFVESLLFKQNFVEHKSISGRVQTVILPGRAWKQLPYIALNHPISSIAIVLSSVLSVWALVHNHPSLFQRMGAIIGGCGVFLQYTANAARKDAIRTEMLVAIAKDSEMRAATIVAKSFRDIERRGTVASSSGIPQKLPTKFSEFEKIEMRTFMRIEMILIAVGTIQATFGDWFVSLTHCGELTC